MQQSAADGTAHRLLTCGWFNALRFTNDPRAIYRNKLKVLVAPPIRPVAVLR